VLTKEEQRRTTLVLLQVRLDVETSAVCIAVLWFRQANIYLAFEYIFYIFFNRQRFGAEGILISDLHKALDIVRHLIEHPTHIQAPMTLPTRPYVIFSTLQGTQNPCKKPTLQRAKNVSAQPVCTSGLNSSLQHQQDNYCQQLIIF
jgi:hypothetical protein